MKLYSPSGASLHRLCCSDLPMGIGSRCGPVVGESELRTAVAKVHSEHDRGIFLDHRYLYKIRADSVRLSLRFERSG